MSETKCIPSSVLEEFSRKVLQKVGVPKDQASTAAKVLIWASLHGIDSHGVRNLKPMYIDPITAGKIKIDTEFKIINETPVSVVADGGSGLGLVAAEWAMQLAIEKAENSGICLVSMRNSHHFGPAGYYSMLAVPRNMVGLSMSGYFFAEGSEYGVLPTFGNQPMLSTNPISIAFPSMSKPAFLLDMATSIVPYNRVLMMQEAGQPVPAGWGLDSNGQPTQDPAKLRQLLPLGGTRETGGHKGFCLGLMVEVFCAFLSGGWMDTSHTSKATDFNLFKQHNDAHFFGAFRLDLFRSPDDFKKDLDKFIDIIHAAPAEPGRDHVYYPGEVEHIKRKKRIESGIPINDHIWSDLRDLSIRFNVPIEVSKGKNDE